MASAIVVPLAYSLRGSQGLIAAGVAAAICWLGAIIAAPMSSLFHGPTAPMYTVTFSMLARTVLPLALGVTVYLRVPALAAAGMIYYLLVFYALVLFTETVVSVAQIPHDAGAQHTT